eukprot:5843940-Heterocapsa_arctica.AAC.1
MTHLNYLNDGPWESTAWFQKQKEAASQWLDHADHADPLFNMLCDSISGDRGAEATGAPEHKAIVLKEIAAGSC